MKKVLLVGAQLIIFCGLFCGCAHRTSMSDPKLRDFYSGKALEQEEVAKAIEKWPDDKALIEMQEAFSMFRSADISDEAERTVAKGYLERAVASFEDLKDPNNFSVAFTPDAKTPYRGRPYERVLASMFLGILDIADGRCEMALPTLRNAEFLDARWQPFQFGSDAPMVYALNLRCLYQTKASEADIQRAKEGLFRALRMREGLDTIRVPIEDLGKYLKNEDVALQVSYQILDAGISSSLMESDRDADPKQILDRVVDDALKFFMQVLKDENDPLHEIMMVLTKKLESKIGAKGDSVPSSYTLTHLRTTLQQLVDKANINGKLNDRLAKKIQNANNYLSEISKAAQAPRFMLLFSGVGPKIRTKGQYKEVAQIVPYKEENASPQVNSVQSMLSNECGLRLNPDSSLSIVLCSDALSPLPPPNPQSSRWEGLRLWSSSYQATSMVGRRFDQILKGRAQFRLGADTAAQIGIQAASALFEASRQAEIECRKTGKNCDTAQNLQMAGAFAGIFAGVAWLGGKAVNPEADTRFVPSAFESGYLMLRRN